MDDKRLKIINASLKLFVSLGVHTVTVAQIGKEAKVGIGTIYKHFKDKEDIVQQIWIEQKKQEADYIFAHYKDTGTVKERFDFLWGKVIDYFVAHPLEYQFSYQFASSPILTDSIHEIAMEAFLSFDKLFQEGLEQNLFKKLKANHLRLFTFGTINGYILWALDEHIAFENDFKNMLLQMLWDAIKA